VNYCKKIETKSHLKIGKIIGMLGMNRTKYYDWRERLGLDNNHNGKIPKSHWLTPEERGSVIEYAKSYITEHSYYLKDGYRRIAYNGIDKNIFAVSPSSVYRILKDTGLLNRWQNKPSKKGRGYQQPIGPHKEWHTDIKYVNFKGTFLFFISVLDGYSRYILHHESRESMTELDVQLTIQRALEKYPDKKPKLISDNGGQYISNDFKNYMKELGLLHVRISPNYPQSNGKIERFHRSFDNECLSVKSMFNLEDAKMQIAKYIDYYNNNRLHSSLNYLRPVDYLNGNVDELLKIRQEKLDAAAANREEYWEQKKHVA
jgi:putative transposase